MKQYTVISAGDKATLRKGILDTNKHGLHYFIADWNKAKKYDGIPLYHMNGVGMLKYQGTRTKSHIDECACYEL